ncbi:MAG: dTDP-4-dehydrorhamnose reductase [bacterium]|nr:dTDP-4-dehydrorhamnose reductase [bacterium]
MDSAVFTCEGVTMYAEDVLQRFLPYGERILITGCHGLLGQKLHRLLSPTNTVIGFDISPETMLSGPSFEYRLLDITKRNELIDAVIETAPRFIINTAAMTAVDRCENERDHCWRVNVLAVENLIRAAQKIKAHLIHISSDYVFDGTCPPYKETDVTKPLGFYGKSKLASENAIRGADVVHTIVRTQVLYGVARNIRLNFVNFIVGRLQEQGSIPIVTDQIGTPTLADDLATGIARIVQLQRQGIYHISGSESISRYDFARKIAVTFDEDPDRIEPIKTKDLNQASPRPADSSFSLDKIKVELLFYPRDVDRGLDEYKAQLRQLQEAPGGKSR